MMDAKEKYKKWSLNENTTVEDLLKHYTQLAATFEQRALDDEYIGPSKGPKQLNEKLSEYGYKNDAQIMDLGCGTGLAGETLFKLGYKNVDGLDFSDDMLKICKEKGIYRCLYKGLMGSEFCSELGVAADQYDAVMGIGVFAPGHVKGKAMDDFVYVVKSGGLIAFYINDIVEFDLNYGYHKKMDELSQEGKWKLLSKCHEPKYDKRVGGTFYIYQKL
ncbi:uncharacterized protein LOC124454055 isoform X2 [Xenia sp. Carnegie-2017]|nr:uncharacterized protein LOC124454055 isoform X2 [Xenia sp. Carnegie-2017]XP_046860818.1 uncharacterized protein LOC124454055 isoform X2 [Xenia sp. Carnegie-2017]